MSDTKTMSTSARFAQIVSILRKHHIQKGMDPVKFRMILEDLGPTFVKIGQIMSTRQDLFSQRYCKELMKLRSHVTPMPFSMVEQIIQDTYGDFIEKLDIDFGSGFSVITGETGAGKSIILGAIGLLLGQRADVKAIRRGASKCIIEARFDISAYGMRPFFEENELEYDDEECILRREVQASGKSRAFCKFTFVIFCNIFF